MNTVKTDCRYFDGYKPCRFHKIDKRGCHDCRDYCKIEGRILVIKLEAAGEVLRSTPVLKRIRELYPDSEITLVTKYAQLVNRSLADRFLPFTFESCLTLMGERFDLVYSLDKSHAACSLAKQLKTGKVKGFTMSDLGRIIPADGDASTKWLRGVDDDLMMQNRTHYIEELFEICGLSWNGQEYILPPFPDSASVPLPEGFLVGIQTGAGAAWRTRVLSDRFLRGLIEGLHAVSGLRVLLLGGPEEDARNRALTSATGALYYGIFDYPEFIALMDRCSVVITPVTLALHLAIGLKKRVVLLNNIFNRHEFHLYGNGIVIEPDLACVGCYKPAFDKACPVDDCTELYDREAIVGAVRSWKGSYGKR
jgi:heptosyltransferase-2